MSMLYGDYAEGQYCGARRERQVNTYSGLVTRYELTQNTAERAQECRLDCGLDDRRLHRKVGAVVATKANLM